MHEPQRQRSDPEPGIRLTIHASQRMDARGISDAAVQAALQHGRVVYVRGAAIHAIGQKEISRCQRQGIDLSRYEGIQIVCTHNGSILTAYRNRDFRGLRPRRRRWATAQGSNHGPASYCEDTVGQFVETAHVPTSAPCRHIGSRCCIKPR